MELLREKDPDGYRLVVENIREIRPDDESRKRNRLAAVDPATGVAKVMPWRDGSPRSVAASLVHEAMHVYLYRNGSQYSREEEERLAGERDEETFYRLTSK